MAAKKRPVRNFFWRHSAAIALLVMAVFVVAIGFVGYTYVRVTRRFDARTQWDLPSRIYSDSTPIVPGLTYPRALFEPKLNHVGYFEVSGPVSQPGEYRYVDNDLEIHLQPFDYPDMEFHGLAVRVDLDGGTVRAVRRLDNGAKLRGVRVEPQLITSIFDDVMEDRVPVHIEAVPQHLLDAIVASEDRSFFQHEGISLRGILRAAVDDLREKSLRSGGSTLTQQLVKNLYLNPERKFRRKLHEALMAILLELRYSKREILEAYLNEAYLGQNGSVQIVGVEQASQVYFGKRAKNLTLSESATIAGILPSPNVYSPLRHADRAKEKRDIVLRVMLEQKKIEQAAYDHAIEEPLSRNKYPRAFNSAPSFVDLVISQLRQTYPETQLTSQGLRVFTTLDTIMQESAEKALADGLDSLNKRYKHIRTSKTPVEGAVLTIEPGTGYVKALVGGRSYRKGQFNRAFQAKRQPGSLFKPFVYVAAMSPERGNRALTAATVLDDSPISIPSGSKVWEPSNYDGRFHGPVTVRRALALSYNIPAVRAAMDAGMPNVIKLASNVGVQSKLQPYPSVSLGSFEVTPLELAYAYSVFANEGVKAEPISILSVVKRDGTLLENREVQMRRVAPASVCYVIDNMLQDVIKYGTAARLSSLAFTKNYAGKTGTTNNYRDAWFVGYSPRILSLVWVGFDDGHNLRLTGSEAAVPIWASHMKRVAGMVPSSGFRRPDNVVEYDIDETTGMLATPYCPETRLEVFVKGTEPTELCEVHAVSEDLPFILPGILRGEPGPAEATAEEETKRSDSKREKKRKKGLSRVFGWIFE